MTEDIRRPVEARAEQEKPLTLTLSNKEQEVVYGLVSDRLQKKTAVVLDLLPFGDKRFGHHFESEETIALRNLTTELARNLEKPINPATALSLGLVDLLPPGALEAFASKEVYGSHSLDTKQLAEYFLEERAKKQKPQQPSPQSQK